MRLPAPTGPDVPIYRSLEFGRLASFQLLDTRQYRSDQPCGSTVDVGPPCADIDAPEASMLGDVQSKWLAGRLEASRARWNIVAQQVMVGPVELRAQPAERGDHQPRPVGRVHRGAARACCSSSPRLAPNPVVITGDIHSSWVHDLVAETSDASGTDDRVVATELVGTSITSRFALEELVRGAVASQPTIKYFEGTKHGYVRAELDRDRLRADFRYVSGIDAPTATIETGASFVVEAGVPGAVPGMTAECAEEAIRALVCTYAERLDAGDLDGVAALFEHGSFRSAQRSEPLVGTDAVRRMYDPVIVYDDGTPRTKHVLGNLEVEVAPDGVRATARCTFVVMQAVDGSPMQAVLAGRYHDRFERADGAWRFVERTVHPDLMGDLPRHMGRSGRAGR